MDAGATLVCDTVAKGLLREGDRPDGAIVGVRTDRPDGDLTAPLVIACDGVNSFLAKEAGLYGEVDPANYTLGVKEMVALPRETIEQRFNVRDRDGVDFEILGCTQGIPGGGFLYTNLDTVSVGVVAQGAVAGRPVAAARGDHRPDEGALRHRPAHRGRRGQGVLARTSSPRPGTT